MATAKAKPKAPAKTAPTQASAPATEQPAAAATAPTKDTQNGITRPASGTQTGKVWEIADKLSEAAGKPIERAAVVKAGETAGLNPATVTTQYGRWRKYHGLGRSTAAVAEGGEEGGAEDGAAVEVEE